MKEGVVLLAHGTPESLDQMPEYLARVRGGRPPSEELVREMAHNYAAIGGRSPLTDITRAQAQALETAIGRPVYVGMRNWDPLIPDALARAAADGVDRLRAIPLAPQYSSLSVAKYRDAVEQARPSGIDITFAGSWHEHPLLLEAFAEKLRAQRESFVPDAVLFTAHSLPARVVSQGDPYPAQVRATAAGVAARAGLETWGIAYQSAGRTPEPWLGPSVDEMLAIIGGQGAGRVLLCPVGFVCDHTEILFDLDIQAAAAARAAGVALARTESLNTSPTFIRALADLALA